MKAAAPRFDAAMRGRLFARLLLLQATWSFERMQGLGFAFALDPWLKTLYPRKADRLAALERHAEYFNTQPYAASLILGLVCSLEEKAAELPTRQRAKALERLALVKKGAGAALAGLGDAFFWGALRPTADAAALCAGLLLGGRGAWTAAAVTAAGVYVLVYNAPALWVRWRGLSLGYEWGEQLPARLKDFSAQAWVRRVRAAGAALTALAVAELALASEPRVRGVGLAAFAMGLVAYKLAPDRVSAVRLYYAGCAGGACAGAAGWVS